MHRPLLSAAIVALCLTSGGAQAASLRVSPVRVEVQPGAATSSIRLWNNEKRAIGVQVRVFRSKFVDGEEWLEATSDVVASPPMTTLAADSENLVRIVRVSRSPVAADERYRLLVDELPDPKRSKAGMINVLVRQSIPVHFAGGN